jgi:hypothetical protein
MGSCGELGGKRERTRRISLRKISNRAKNHMLSDFKLPLEMA